jgi:hypothetical protein
MMMIVEQLIKWESAEETEVLGENCLIATLSTKNSIWPDLGSKQDRCGGKLASNHLSYGTAVPLTPSTVRRKLIRYFHKNPPYLKTVSSIRNRKCNTCANSYITAYNSSPKAYLILKVISNWKNKDWSIQKWCSFCSQNKILHCLNNYPKHVIIFLILQIFNRLPRLNRKRWIRTYWSEIR